MTATVRRRAIDYQASADALSDGADDGGEVALAAALIQRHALRIAGFGEDSHAKTTRTFPVPASESWSITANPIEVVQMSKPKIRGMRNIPIAFLLQYAYIDSVANREAVDLLFAAN